MQVVIANPGQPADIAQITSDLPALQAVVHGYLEHWATVDHVCFLCNEEGRLHGMPINRTLTLPDQTQWTIVGPILLVGLDADTGEFESLTPGEALFWQTLLNDGQELF